MVNETDLKPVIEQIGNSYPSFAGWYGSLTGTQRQGIRDSWLRQVAKLEPSDVQSAAGEILDGRVEMPKNYEFDRLGILLRTWGNVAAARRIEEQNTQHLRRQATPSGDGSVKGVNYRFGPSIKCAAAWGSALRSGHITPDDNAAAMEIVHRHHRHGDVELMWPQVVGDQKSLVEFWQGSK